MTMIEIPYTTKTGRQTHVRFLMGVKEFFLTGRKITSIDLTALQACTNLQTLGLGGNQLVSVDLSPLQHCTNLQTLVLGGNPLVSVDLSPLQHCTNLRQLYLGGDQLVSVDLSPLQHCTNLQTLRLCGSPLVSVDLSPLQHCTNLQTLIFDINQLVSVDLSPLQHCTNLQTLRLSRNQLVSVKLSPIQRLKYLELDENQLSAIDLSPLQHCTNLEWLRLNENQLSAIDLSPLQHCTNLTRLNLGGNQLVSVDLSPLQHCTNLGRLNISRNQLVSVDLSPLQHCTNLGELRLNENQLVEVDLSPLFLRLKLRNLEFDLDVVLTANPLLRGSRVEQAFEAILGRIVWRGPIGKPWPSYPKGMVLHNAIEIEAGPLGEGVAGEVFRAKLIHPYGGLKVGQRVAVKIYKSKVLKEKEQRERIDREYLAGSTLDHPHLVKLYGREEDGPDGRPYLVMEWIDGPTLTKWVKDKKQLSEDEIVTIFRQLCEATLCMHGVKMVHRDIKPDNIMLLKESPLHAKLMDFGVVWIKILKGITPSAKFLGTIRYGSREYLFQKHASEKSDAYALGAVLYFLLSGKEVYGDLEEPNLVSAIEKRNPTVPQLESTASQGLQRLRAVAQRLLRQNPDTRGTVEWALKSIPQIKIEE